MASIHICIIKHIDFYKLLALITVKIWKNRSTYHLAIIATAECISRRLSNEHLHLIDLHLSKSGKQLIFRHIKVCLATQRPSPPSGCEMGVVCSLNP